MRLYRIQSSNIAYIGYNPKTLTLNVYFGKVDAPGCLPEVTGVYSYAQVAPGDVTDLIFDPRSVGSYFSSEFKKDRQGTKLEGQALIEALAHRNAFLKGPQ